MTDYDFDLSLAGMSLDGGEVTECYAYYYVYPCWPMQTADYFLVRGGDGKYGFMAGNGAHLPENGRFVHDTVLDGRKYRIVWVRIPERALTRREESVPEQWRMFDYTELRCHVYTDVMYNKTTERLLLSFLTSGYAGYLE